MTKRQLIAKLSIPAGKPGHIPDDVPLFVLQGKDILAADLVFEWVRKAGVAQVNLKKVREAFDCAQEFQNYHTKNIPD